MTTFQVWKVRAKYPTGAIESFSGSRELVRDWLEERLSVALCGVVWCREFFCRQKFSDSEEIFRQEDMQYIFFQRDGRIVFENIRIGGLGVENV